MKLIKTEIDYLNDLEKVCELFLQDIGKWAYRVMNKYPDGFVSDSHDGGTFMTPWSVYIKYKEDEKVLNFMKKYRDNSSQHFKQTGQWHHGYWKKQEAHHGPEHFQIFLYTLWQLDPEDEITKNQFIDATEHIGNWEEGIPEWYDREAGLMRSMYLGTEYVGDPAINVPDHIRFVDLALKAYQISEKKCYVNFASNYTQRWSEAINNSESLPIGLSKKGGVYKNILEDSEYGNFVGAAPDDLDNEILKAENLLASGFPDVLLNLWEITGRESYLRAAEKIIEVSAEVVTNPIAWQVQAAIRKYRDITGKNKFDRFINGVSDQELRKISKLYINPEPERKEYKDAMGMRTDKPEWKDEMGNIAPGPLLQALYGLINEDEKVLLNSINLARSYFNLGKRVYGDINEHGCTSQALHSIARGHGRLNGAGVVTEVLVPVLRYLK
ncbi:MAG: hypothetical protein ACOCQ5_01995 [Halanaerobiales bacterium]